MMTRSAYHGRGKEYWMSLYSAPLASSDSTRLCGRRLSPNGPAEYADLALEMCCNPYYGEDVRHGGAIRTGLR
jgi:hypothetical protein